MSDPIEPLIEDEGLIAIAWQGLERVIWADPLLVVPKSRRHEMKCAFYAGAQTVMDHVLEVGQEDDSPQEKEAGVYRLASIQLELRKFAEALIAAQRRPGQ